MFGRDVEFNCKNCGRGQITDISFVALYKINKHENNYIKLNCGECKTPHYVAIDVCIVEELTDENKEKEFEKFKIFFGGSERARERFFKQTQFITIEESVILVSEARDVQDGGVAAF